MSFAFLVVIVGGAVFLARWLQARSGGAPSVTTVPVQSSREAIERAIADRRRRDAA